jgi:predicted nucleotidyltransferase
MPDTDSPFEHLREKHGQSWPALSEARQLTRQRIAELQSLDLPQSDNTTLVVFGSFARGEVTPGSDIDWTLLVDGPSDPEHFRLAQEIRKKLAEFPDPGTTETFGTLTSSHELIHNIGGIRDTNQNMTRRILLLLESLPLNNEIVHERVLRGVLNRYIIFGQSLSWQSGPEVVIPRFLLNDIVRFWRTMAVDYAAKQWEQPEKKWALRNAKLRFSRKLLFVAGLLICFSFELEPPPDREAILLPEDSMTASLAGYFLEQTRLTPIDLLSKLLLQQPQVGVVLDVMGAYDSFLALLADDDKRKGLEGLQFEAASNDPLFTQVRDLSRRFQDGLTHIFFQQRVKLTDLMVKFGVF